ncbi:MAG: BamA/TamA family outer membrane protein [Gammaproteobacteria bacterium]
MRQIALYLCVLAATCSAASQAAPSPAIENESSSALLTEGTDPAAVADVEPRKGIPTPGELERLGARIGQTNVAVDDIFNEEDPREDRLLYRLANKLHIDTRDTTVLAQVLLKPGEPYTVQRAEETARILRDKRYLYDAVVEPTHYDPATNTVDVLVRVRDVWSLSPGIGVGRSGGTNKTRARVVDENFLGRGQYVAVGYTSDVDRSGLSFDFRDQNFFNSWWGVDAGYTDSSDGSTSNIAIGRPFFSLDSHWSAGMSAVSRDQITPMYDLGEKTNEFRQQDDYLGLDGGWSRGLENGWTTRWLTGFRYDRSRFSDAGSDADMPTTLIPEDRTLSYPWVGIELIQDRFETTRNQDQIGRTEDVFLGKSLRLELGWTAGIFGGDRSAGIFSLGGRLGNYVGRRGLIFAESSWNGRLESGQLADSLLSAGTHYYLRFNDKNVFTASANVQHGVDLDVDHQLLLGGDTGLRGYPLRYQNGDTLAVMSVEQRYFTDWFPFRLVRVGAAVFADVGRTWGQAPLASEPQGWLTDVGIGLRLGNARSGLGNVLHVDLAFPIGASSDISSVQLLLEAQKTF